MRTTISGREVTTTLTSGDRAMVHRLLARLGPHASLPALGRYRKLSSDQVWLRIVSQICVMGSAKGMERILAGADLTEAFTRATSLAAWKKHGFERDFMAGVLREHSATRFHGEAAGRLQQVLEAPSAVVGTRVVLLDDLPRSTDPNVVREELMRRCPAFKRKSASDFMIETGISHDVIALDVRVVGAFKKYLGYETPVSRVQGSRRIYLSVEQALRSVCDAAGCKLGLLDRTIFQFTGVSALRYVMEFEGQTVPARVAG